MAAGTAYRGAPPEFVQHVRDLEARAGTPMVLVHEATLTVAQAAALITDPSGSGWGTMSAAEAEELRVASPTHLAVPQTSSAVPRDTLQPWVKWALGLTAAVLIGGGAYYAWSR